MKVLPGPKTAPCAKGEGAEFLKEFNKSDLNSNPKGGNEEDEDEEHQNGRHQQRAECGVQ